MLELVTLALLVSSAGPIAVKAAPCDYTIEVCSVTNTGTAVEIGATRPGGGAGGGNGGGGDGGGGGGNASPSTPRNVYDPNAGGPVPIACPNDDASLCEAPPAAPDAPAIPWPTLSDVASFAPSALPLVDEPDGVGIVGMPMNFVLDAQPHSVTGTLFGLPVTVRFTPASFLFHHGDGTSRESPTGGRTWSQLGLAQFSATATSHAYTARGTYTAGAVARYAADVDFGGGWVAVPGLLEVPTAAMDIQILEVRTALVDQTCLENPTGPGC